MSACRIIGIDPGSRCTGWGCVELDKNKIRHVSHGSFALSDKFSTKNSGVSGVAEFADRLVQLHESLETLFHTFKPNVVAVESLFFAKNVQSVLKLGQVRGVILLSAAAIKIEIAEYAPREIKQAVAGNGGADKSQVEKMVRLILGLGQDAQFKTQDESDGLAIAVCHGLQSRPSQSLKASQKLQENQKSKLNAMHKTSQGPT
jgi:crossover junction endodeoxyribonuclease RuvC